MNTKHMSQKIESNDLQRYLSRIHIQQLKGLKNVEFDLKSNRVTGIFGKNGSGKTTLLHAILCLYRSTHPNDWMLTRMSQYFKYTDNVNFWIGSEYSAQFDYFDVKKHEIVESPVRPYYKHKTRWYPPQSRKPQRPIYFFQIHSCVPDIERFNSTTVTFSPRNVRHVNNEEKVVAKASYILCYRYQELEENDVWKAHCLKVVREDGLAYHSFSMGAGEQRLIRILNTLYNAEKYSLILIDEIDLTLHTAALLRLIDVMVEVAEDRQLQIIFTSHRQELLNVTKIKRYYLMQNIGGDTICLDNPYSDCYDDLIGFPSQPLTIFVEDDFASVIVNYLLRKKGLRTRVAVRKFGGSQNAFAIAAALCRLCTESEVQNYLIVTDGDIDDMLGETNKLSHMQKFFGGNTTPDVALRKKAIRIISEFCTTYDSSSLTCNRATHLLHPEEYVYESIRELTSASDTELMYTSNSLIGLTEHHEYTIRMCENEYNMEDVIRVFAENSIKWASYVQNINHWLDERSRELQLGILKHV